MTRTAGAYFTSNAVTLGVSCGVPILLILMAIPGSWSGEWDFSHYLVTNSVVRKLELGMETPPAFPKGFRVWKGEPEPSEPVYLKQFGLPCYAIAYFIYWTDSSSELEQTLLWLRYPFGILAGFLYGALLFWVWKHLGLWPWCFAVLYYVFAQNHHYFCHGYYWSFGTYLAPVALMWWGYRPESARTRRWVVGGGFALLICVKCLCCYEFFTAPLIAALCIIPFTAIQEQWPIRKTLPEIAWYFAAGASGFLVAVSIHFFQLYTLTSSWADAWANSLGNAAQRSYIGSQMSIADQFQRQFRGVYGTHAMDKPVSLLIAAAAILGTWAYFRSANASECPSRLRATVAATAVAFLAGFAWMIVMRQHTSMHPEFNAMGYYCGFSVLAPALLGLILGEVVRKRNTTA